MGGGRVTIAKPSSHARERAAGEVRDGWRDDRRGGAAAAVRGGGGRGVPQRVEEGRRDRERLDDHEPRPKAGDEDRAEHVAVVRVDVDLERNECARVRARAAFERRRSARARRVC